jgi:hypothetical protein
MTKMQPGEKLTFRLGVYAGQKPFALLIEQADVSHMIPCWKDGTDTFWTDRAHIHDPACICGPLANHTAVAPNVLWEHRALSADINAALARVN